MFPTINASASAISAHGRALAQSAQLLNRAFSTGLQPVQAIDQSDTENRADTAPEGRPAARDAAAARPRESAIQAEPDPVQAAVRMIQDETGIRASAAVLKRLDDTVGTLLDVFG